MGPLAESFQVVGTAQWIGGVDFIAGLDAGGEQGGVHIIKLGSPD